MKFKVGDKVKNIRNISGFKLQNMFIGLVGTINEIDDSDLPYHVKFGNYGSVWFKENELELVQTKHKQFTKADLKERYIVKFRNNDEYIVKLKEGIFKGIENGIEKENYNPIKNYSYYLIEKNGFSNLDILEVYKPKYETIWTREEEQQIKEMTIAEIEKELGYAVKVVK